MLQCLIQGILLGGLYAIIGIGMSMVFGIMGLTNLAHGDLMILGTYITMLLTTTSGLPLWLSVLLSVVIMAVIGFVVQNCLVKMCIRDRGGSAPRRGAGEGLTGPAATDSCGIEKQSGWRRTGVLH